MSLTYIGDQVTIYIGLLFLFIGIIGNGINIFIFSTVRTYRTTPSSFYFLCGSIANIIYILINLITRIVTAANGFDLTRTSLIWCKARAFFAGSLSPISLTCSCLATIDQYLVTSKHVHVRACSNIRWAHRIIIIITIIWCIHGIFGPVFYNITSVRCTSTNSVYADYSAIYVIVIICAIPVLLLTVFGCLTYRNLRQTIFLAEQHVDRQLARTILIQVVLIVVSITPYGINSTYRLITSNIKKSIDQQVTENFITIIVTLISYLYYIVCILIGSWVYSHIFYEWFLGTFLHIFYIVKPIS